MLHYVYLIADHENTLLKIGFTNFIRQRMQTLNYTGPGRALRCIGYFRFVNRREAFKFEQALHLILSKMYWMDQHGTHLEWYDFNPKIVKFFMSIPGACKCK